MKPWRSGKGEAGASYRGDMQEVLQQRVGKLFHIGLNPIWWKGAKIPVNKLEADCNVVRNGVAGF